MTLVYFPKIGLIKREEAIESIETYIEAKPVHKVWIHDDPSQGVLLVSNLNASVVVAMHELMTEEAEGEEGEESAADNELIIGRFDLDIPPVVESFMESEFVSSISQKKKLMRKLTKNHERILKFLMKRQEVERLQRGSDAPTGEHLAESADENQQPRPANVFSGGYQAQRPFTSPIVEITQNDRDRFDAARGYIQRKVESISNSHEDNVEYYKLNTFINYLSNVRIDLSENKEFSVDDIERKALKFMRDCIDIR